VVLTGRAGEFSGAGISKGWNFIQEPLCPSFAELNEDGFFPVSGSPEKMSEDFSSHSSPGGFYVHTRTFTRHWQQCQAGFGSKQMLGRA
jgi:hypothetical protein